MAYIGNILQSQFLGKVTATNSATLTFATQITSNYSSYLVKFTNITAVVDGDTFQMAFSTNNGSSYVSANYTNAQSYLYGSGQYSSYTTSSASILDVYTVVTNSSGFGFNGFMNLYNMNDSVNIPNYFALISGAYNGIINSIYGSGNISEATQVNAIQFSFASGNISSGSISLYGLLEN